MITVIPNTLADGMEGLRAKLTTPYLVLGEDGNLTLCIPPKGRGDKEESWIFNIRNHGYTLTYTGI
jgi:hypothetical protein